MTRHRSNSAVARVCAIVLISQFGTRLSYAVEDAPIVTTVSPFSWAIIGSATGAGSIKGSAGATACAAANASACNLAIASFTLAR